MRRSSRLTKAAHVLTAMQCGATLQLSHAGGGGDVWSLSDGRHVRSDIAKLVTANIDVEPAGDGLCPNTPQTFPWAEP